MKFKAEDNDASVVVSLKKLKGDKTKLVELLNNSGFSLGSGHEEVELKKVSEDCYVLWLLPYVGCSPQIVEFNLVSDIK